MNTNYSQMHGNIEITLEDKSGNIKKKIVQHNDLTPEQKSYMFHMNLINGIGRSKRANIRTGYNLRLSENMGVNLNGLYCLKDKVDTNFMYPAPHMLPNGVIDDNKITFYNTDQGTIEGTSTLAAVDAGTYFDAIDRKCVSEYIKSNGVGKVSSIIFAAIPTMGMPSTLLSFTERKVPDMISTYTNANYILEPKKTGTIVWKTMSASDQMSFDYGTGNFNRYSFPSLHTNISNHSQNFKINDTIYKVVRTTQTASATTLTLTYVADCMNSTSLQTIVINLTPISSGLFVNGVWNPVMVYNTDDDTLEIFQTMVQDSINFEYEIHKVTVDLATMEYDTEVLYLKWAISACPYSAITYCGTKNGIYHNGEYYLPTVTCYHDDNILYNTFYTTGSTTSMTTTITGIRLSDDDGVIGTFGYVYRSASHVAATTIATHIIISDNEVRSCRVGMATMDTVISTLTCSYLNLDEPLDKKEYEVLRIRYVDTMP